MPSWTNEKKGRGWNIKGEEDNSQENGKKIFVGEMFVTPCSLLYVKKIYIYTYIYTYSIYVYIYQFSSAQLLSRI